MKHALHIPTVGAFADPRVLAGLAAAADERGWDGFFLWDHLLRPETEPPEVADTLTALAAVASVTLDQLSAGRLILGLGLGHDRWGELRRFGEPQGSPRARRAPRRGDGAAGRPLVGGGGPPPRAPPGS